MKGLEGGEILVGKSGVGEGEKAEIRRSRFLATFFRFWPNICQLSAIIGGFQRNSKFLEEQN